MYASLNNGLCSEESLFISDKQNTSNLLKLQAFLVKNQKIIF